LGLAKGEIKNNLLGRHYFKESSQFFQTKIVHRTKNSSRLLQKTKLWKIPKKVFLRKAYQKTYSAHNFSLISKNTAFRSF